MYGVGRTYSKWSSCTDQVIQRLRCSWATEGRKDGQGDILAASERRLRREDSVSVFNQRMFLIADGRR